MKIDFSLPFQQPPARGKVESKSLVQTLLEQVYKLRSPLRTGYKGRKQLAHLRNTHVAISQDWGRGSHADFSMFKGEYRPSTQGSRGTVFQSFELQT